MSKDDFPLIGLWGKRSLVFNFALMNIKIRYKGTYLGLFWTALEPLLLFVLLYVVFTGIRTSNKEDFAIYLLIGIILHHTFARGTQGGMMSLRENISILSSINIKRELFPVTTTVTASLLLLVEVAVFLGFMPFVEFIPEATIILLPIVLFLLFFLILGVSYFLSVINAFTRDVQPLWGIIVMALFFITPIFWYIDEASGILLDIHNINPLGQLVEIAHKVIFGEIPHIDDWLYVSAWIFGIFFVGKMVFNKLEKNILEKM
ncbi:MAG: ABC transporter permease [Nitrosopumilus sp.]|nr:ABC transporter permease [Nitrosopumilus sp.]MDH3385533.1 ABC transporter permease [Nitrosopumilus sp.]